MKRYPSILMTMHKAMRWLLELIRWRRLQKMLLKMFGMNQNAEWFYLGLILRESSIYYQIEKHCKFLGPSAVASIP